MTIIDEGSGNTVFFQTAGPYDEQYLPPLTSGMHKKLYAITNLLLLSIIGMFLTCNCSVYLNNLGLSG